MSYTSLRWRTALVGTAAALALLLPQGVAHAAPEENKIDKTLAAALDKSPASFLVHLKGSANLSAAGKASAKSDKSEQVLKAKTAYAAGAQADLRNLLTERKAEFTPFWVVNAVKVTGDSALAAEIAKLPDVQRIEADRTISRPQPKPAKEMPKVNAIEWNIDRIGAPRVWSEYGTRGEGVVVGSIGDGVQFDHPALADKYRGRKADGTVDHNYNWLDAEGICSSTVPCDLTGGGTHAMGTAVGGTATETIGVAPGAKWIAANVCCTISAMLQASQWMLAPTDLTGRNPRPDLAPDVVTTQWTDETLDSWFAPVLDAWVAAGIFPVFSAGTDGPACGTTRTPGAALKGYSVGAFDSLNAIAPFSSRGAGQDGEIKPNITAPGVNVRSAVPGGYRPFSANSTSHVAGAVALLWSLAPGLKGDIQGTRTVLDHGAADVSDLACGGSPAKNNTWGEGRLDVYASARVAPVSQTGGLSGTITSGGQPLDLATVTLTGPLSRKIVTGKDGKYALPRLLTGGYQVTVRKLGYGQATANIVVQADRPTVHNASLNRVATYAVSGTLTAEGAPQAGVRVAVADSPTEATTDASGRYQLTLPTGTHQLQAVPPSGRCSGPATVSVTVRGTTNRNIALPRRTDNFGYACSSGTAAFAQGTDLLAGGTGEVALPFTFPFYDGSYSRVWITNSGYASFVNRPGPLQPYLPSIGTPNATVYPFANNTTMDASSGIYTDTAGTAPNRTFVIEWRNVMAEGNAAKRVSFSAVIGESGTVKFHYQGGDGLRSGAATTVGIENEQGNDAFLFSHGKPDLADGQVLTFAPTRHGLLTGTVTDAGTGQPLADAIVNAGGAEFTTDADGTYLGHVPVGSHLVIFSKENYNTVQQTATVSVGVVTRVNAALSGGSLSVSTNEVEMVMPGNDIRTQRIKITNNGNSTTAYSLAVEPPQGWLSIRPTNGQLAPGASANVTLTVNSSGLAPGEFRRGKLVVRAGSSLATAAEVAVTLAVPRHQVALDAGGTLQLIDPQGDTWNPDRAYTVGGHGYVGAQSRVTSTTRPIFGTVDQELFRTAREAMTEYRFDNVPSGVYTVELGFAELGNALPGGRVFDVLAEGQIAVPLLDLTQQVGQFTAATYKYTVRVTDGQLNLRFAPFVGAATVNSVRITERPDKTAP
ncbi:carboxypeptidase regulatory-like domain-containing protein [Sinosporangium siamense]|uniref:alpha-amylase n=1 Tax=Sinosporangium siamense TaxID=1367973 RepID=A0A919RPY8_9ACTN|nr:carboxypeptidase regulatory-like domain-containing protein [Sinosporangium siamense]GII96509.1 hypothetical protein Ssi02_67400 [Sinosporangium siamense]